MICSSASRSSMPKFRFNISMIGRKGIDWPNEMQKRNFGIEDRDAEEQIIAKIHRGLEFLGDEAASVEAFLRDRKSTRLNSSHGYISYAVFCLKKKKQPQPARLTEGNTPRFQPAPRTG